jgi:hypothetical protein
MFTLLNVMIVMNDSLPKKPWSITTLVVVGLLAFLKEGTA